MSFRPEGYLLVWEAEAIIREAVGPSISDYSFQEAATKIFGQEWFDERNCQSEKHPGISVVIETDGSTAYILNTVLTRWVFRSNLGSEFLPLYFCSPTGQIVRTLSPAMMITPFERNAIWINFNPIEASLDDYIEAFMGIEIEEDFLINEAGMVKPLGRRPWPWQRPTTDEREFGLNWADGVRPFVGWSACVPRSDSLFDASEMISLSLRASGYTVTPGEKIELTFGSTRKHVAPKRSGRPSLQPEIIAHYRKKYPDGRKGQSLSEVARVLGYDRKTTRKALQEGGLLSEDDQN